MQNILAAGLRGLAVGLLALPALAAQLVAVPSNLPLFFETGQGQANVPAQFIARGHDYQFLVSAAGVQMALRKTDAESAAVRMQFVGANPQAQIHGDAELPGKVNYLTGNDPAQWRKGVGLFAKVRVGELYPGINLVYYGNQQQLEYDFDIAPGTDPDVIAIHFDGPDKISVNAQGELVLNLAGGEIRQPKPVIYQTVGGAQKEIEGGYRLVDARTAAFVIGQYDHGQALVIDPVLGYSTYFGGNAGETAYAVAYDTNGFVYMTGQTFSSLYTNGVSFYTSGAFQTNYAGGKLTGDAFVAKFGNAGNLVYETYLGGSADDGALGVAVDSAGDAYVTGFTDSTNFPTKSALHIISYNETGTNIYNGTNISGRLDKSFGYYPVDAFVTELDPSGANLIYSTYLGGSSMDCGMAIAVDATGNAYVTGYTYSSNFPTVNALQNLNKLACTNSFYFNANAFIVKIGPGGTNLVYSTYFGGTNFDEGKGIAVDTNGSVYVTGYTASTNFPTQNAVAWTNIWTNIVVTGHTSITNTFTNSFNGYLLNGTGSTNKTSTAPTYFAYDAFVAKFDSIGTNLDLVYSTFLGGTNSDVANGIAVDNNGAAYVTGWTVSTNFPNTAGLYSFMVTNTTSFPATNVFLTKILTAVTDGVTNAVIAWSAVFGGKGADIGYGVAVDPAGNVFVTGSASSTNFPTCNVPGLMSRTNSGKSDAFVIAFTNTTANTVALLYSGYLGGKDDDYGYGIAVDANDNAYVVGQTLSTNFPTFNGEFTYRNGTNDAFLTQIILAPEPPAITTQPGDQAVAVSSNATFSVAGNVAGPQPFFYQWQSGTNLGTNLVTAIVTNVLDGTTNIVTVTNLINGENISGATNSTLTITNAQTTNSSFYYQVIVTNYGGSATSSVALLTVTNILPAITVPPASQTNGVGTTVKLAVTAIGTPPLSYQWWYGTNLVKNGAGITGTTSNVLTFSSVQLTNTGSYTVVVTNTIYGGSAATNASLTVESIPVIVLQPTPTNQAMAVSSNATFTVNAIGTVPLSYQWWMDGTKLVNGTNLVNGSKVITSGATTNVLIIGNAQTNNSGNYTVSVTNISGSATSSVALLTVTNILPAITVPPASQTNGVGTIVNLAVTATGSPPLSYQWWAGTNLVKNGAGITGATSNVLTFSSVQLTNGGIYTVVVTNTIYGGSAATNASLTVVSSPVIVLQPTPTNQVVVAGSNATFTVTAIGTVPLSYQWWVNGTNLVKNGGSISGATTNVLIIGKAQMINSGNYTVIVTNIAGSVTSSVVATLRVTNFLPSITGPTNQTVAVGTPVTLAVTATGTAPLSYQWQMNGTNLVNSGRGGQIGGATTDKLTIGNAQTNNSGGYSVIVTNYGGSVTSSVAILTVASAPVITIQPTNNQTVVVGTTVTNAVTAVGIAPLKYQWWVDGTNLVNGATNSVLTIINAQTNNSGSYTVIVTNNAGSVTSSAAILTVASSPVITMQPTNRTVGVGAIVTFAVTAIGTAPLSYQWQDGTNILVDGGQINGAISNVLTISNVQLTNSGSYTVTVTNLAGSMTSSNALLTVILPPSFGNIIAADGGGFILSGTGGVSNGTYYVLASSNLLAPLTNWTPIATYQFDGQGGFIFTNAAQTNAPQLFYLLQLP